MGYRLAIRDLKTNKLLYYGTKLYGYMEPGFDYKNFKSYNYLLQIDKDLEDTVWDYGMDNPVEVDFTGLMEFLRFYTMDWNRYANRTFKISGIELFLEIVNEIKQNKEIYLSTDMFIISWE